MDALDPPALAAYLDRLGLAGADLGADEASLARIVWAHVQAIPFENLDVLLRRPIRLDLASVHGKLVGARRGGYCFEHATLLAAALRALGFRPIPLAARVRWLVAPGTITPRTHMLLVVPLPDGPRLVDVGFGGTTPTGPIPLAAGEHRLHHDAYRLLAEAGTWTLQLAAEGGWSDLYVFTEEPIHPIDAELASHFTSTHPASRFLVAPLCARTRPEGRITVRGTERTVRGGAALERTTIEDPAAYLAMLADDLGLVFPPGTRFPGAA